MSLVRRGDSVLVIVDTQPGFLAEEAEATAAVVVQDACFSTSAQAHRFGLERLVGTGVERNHAKGVAFEWMATVEDGRAIRDRDRERWGPPPLEL